MVILDIDKAFDHVWHNGLTYKLITYNFLPVLTKLINNYVTDSKFKVFNYSKISTPRSVIAEILQGSILDPILYNIPKYPLILYVDTAIYATLTQRLQAVLYIQNHLHSLQNYYTYWKI